ncbi:MAG: DUF6644 family protein [Steroidobacteraceae bacterium]
MSRYLDLLDALCTGLAATPASQTIKSVAWIIPTIQTLHILAVATVMTSVLMIDLRLLGVGARERTMAWITHRFLPYVWWPLPVLLATGASLIVAEPARTLKGPVFAVKMGLLILAAGVTLVCQIPLRRDAQRWERSASLRWAARCLAVASLSLWVAIVFAGRWIAYAQGA